mmetsp:Transcript_4396/g.7698  ORF Transcript_4396/g.7698 Transcript_4396/m.7698 type:complete len:201 (+) Transcript_4396:152-754(+)
MHMHSVWATSPSYLCPCTPSHSCPAAIQQSAVKKSRRRRFEGSGERSSRGQWGSALSSSRRGSDSGDWSSDSSHPVNPPSNRSWSESLQSRRPTSDAKSESEPPPRGNTREGDDRHKGEGNDCANAASPWPATSCCSTCTTATARRFTLSDRRSPTPLPGSESEDDLEAKRRVRAAAGTWRDEFRAHRPAGVKAELGEGE